MNKFILIGNKQNGLFSITCIENLLVHVWLSKNMGGDASTILSDLISLYMNDDRPWVVGFSGGKDSTCVLQMVYKMLLDLPPESRHKDVYVLSSDTLVETPIIIKRQKEACKQISESAIKDNIPLFVQLLRPEVNETFWVNLIGKGYPSPNKWFRWCTDRLKIKPMSNYIYEKIRENGEVIILLGARKSESASRSQTMDRYEIENLKLRRHGTISGAFIYTPIEDFSEDEVWEYLLSEESPWGADNKELKNLYRKNDDEEISFIVDDASPPSGHSRFGCWTCTVVDKDRAIESLIEDGHIHYALLNDYREKLKAYRDDPSKREQYRKNQRKSKFFADMMGRELERCEHRGHKVMGPFTFDTRHELLKDLLKLQENLKGKMGDDLELISTEEIRAIEMMWIYEGDDITCIEDVVGNKVDDGGVDALIDRLLIVEEDRSKLSRKTGIYKRLDQVIDEHLFREMVRGRNQ